MLIVRGNVMSSRYDDYTEMPEKKGPRWGKVFAVILSIVLAIVVIGGVLVYLFGRHLFSLSNYVANGGSFIVKEEELPQEAQETVHEEDRQGVKVDESELEDIHKTMSTVNTKIELKSDDDVYNFVLVGVDRRDKSWNGNSDSMMLVSINYDKERVSVISLMRDTYVNIPGVGYNKLNNSYARGGGELLCSTISDNFNIDVSRYAAVDFEDMIEIIDFMGGLNLEFTDAEVEVQNGYVMDMCNTLGLDYMDYLLPAGGEWHVNGLQAVAYARTERQRYVMSKIFDKMSDMSATQLLEFVRKVLPLITHNIKEAEIWEIVSKAPSIIGYDYIQDRVPYDNLYSVIYVNSQDMLVPDWEDTILKMHETIYGDGRISNNADNDLSTRIKNNQEFAPEFEEENKTRTGTEETPYYGDGQDAQA